MTIVFWIILVLFLLLCGLLTAIILLQEPKQSGLGDSLGGGGDFSTAGGGTAGGLHRVTIVMGVLWGLLALALSVVPRV